MVREEMDMEKVLSVVIPSYNVEKYLDRCLSSFVNAEVLRDIEILIINDGSTDKTSEIAEKYCRKYPSSFTLYNKENGGHGSGINYGIEHATGKYFKVVDGDDWVETGNLPVFIHTLKKTNADIVASNYRLVQDGTDQILEERYACKNKYHYGKEWGFAEAVSEPVIKIHSLTIRTDILKENNIRVDEKVFYEDAEYILYPIPFCKNVYYDPTFVYMYRLGRNGQSVDIESMKRHRKDHMQVLNSLFEYYIDHQFIQQYKKKYLERGIALSVQNQYQIYLAMGDEAGIYDKMKRFDTQLREHYPGIYQAVNKKSIWAIRHSNYLLFPFAVKLYKLIKRS